MELTLFILLVLVAYIIYIQKRNEPQRKAREKQFRDPAELHPEVQQALENNQKIAAIKAYRRIYNAGLKEANDVICNLLK